MGRKGQKPGPGRPKKEIEQNYYKWMKEVVTEDEFKEIIREVVKQAKTGSVWSSRFIAEYLMGLPGQVIEVDNNTNHSGEIKVLITEEKSTPHDSTDSD